jgi:hypothetical protein
MSMAQGAAPGSLDTSGLFGEWRRREPTLAFFALVMVVAMAPTLIAMAIDARTFNGINVWMKPFKFELSTAVHMATLAWFWAYLDGSIRARRSVRAIAWAIGLIFLIEVGYIAYRASLAEGSHFNTSTTAAAIAYPLMGIGILFTVAASAWIGVLVLRSSEGGISPTLRLAIGLGLVGGSILGAVTGGYMSAQTGHWVGGVANDVGGLPLFSWSRTGGDLRAAHFVGLHAMQGLPVIGYFVRNVPAGRTIVWASLVMWTAATIFFFLQAIIGRPLLPL